MEESRNRCLTRSNRNRSQQHSLSESLIDQLLEIGSNASIHSIHTTMDESGGSDADDEASGSQSQQLDDTLTSYWAPARRPPKIRDSDSGWHGDDEDEDSDSDNTINGDNDNDEDEEEDATDTASLGLGPDSGLAEMSFSNVFNSTNLDSVSMSISAVVSSPASVYQGSDYDSDEISQITIIPGPAYSRQPSLPEAGSFSRSNNSDSDDESEVSILPGPGNRDLLNLLTRTRSHAGTPTRATTTATPTPTPPPSQSNSFSIPDLNRSNGNGNGSNESFKIYEDTPSSTSTQQPKNSEKPSTPTGKGQQENRGTGQLGDGCNCSGRKCKIGDLVPDIPKPKMDNRVRDSAADASVPDECAEAESPPKDLYESIKDFRRTLKKERHDRKRMSRLNGTAAMTSAVADVSIASSSGSSADLTQVEIEKKIIGYDSNKKQYYFPQTHANRPHPIDIYPWID